MSVFENFISSITGGDLLGKLIVAIVLVCAIAVVSQVLVKWLRHILQRALGVGGIALSLGFQDTLSNLIGGVQISFMKIVKPGDNIQVGSSKGVVQDVTWRHATIKNRLGETVIIPNSVISKNAVVHLPPPERVSVPFVATTCKDLDAVAEEVEKVAHDIALEHSGIVKEPSVLFTEITEGGLAGKVVLEVEDAAQATPVSDAITRAIAPLVRA